MGISSGFLSDKYWRTSEFKEENEPCKYHQFMKLRHTFFLPFWEEKKK